MKKVLHLFLFAVVVISQHACVSVDKVRYFEPIDTEGLSKLPLDKWARGHDFSWAKQVVAYKKTISDSSLHPVGDFIIERYDPINIQSLFLGPIVPFLPMFLLKKDVLPNHQTRTILRLGLNYYDTCQNFLRLGDKSFCVVVNGTDTVASYFHRADRDCELEWIRSTDKKIKCSLNYFFSVDRPFNPIKTIKLLPRDKEANACIKPISFVRKNHLDFYFFFPLPH